MIPKKTWKTINSILSNKRKIECHIVLTGDNDEDICDSLEMGNKFCNFFSTIADNLLHNRQLMMKLLT